MSTSINNTIVCNEPHANLDVYYGPYDNIDAALEALSDVTIAGVTYHKRHVGLTIGIWNMAKTDITEYWFKGGISDSNLTEKSSGGGGGGLPGNIKVVTFDKNGATGTQNSVLTDNDSKVCLPQPTIVLSGSAFAGWRYGSSTHQAGDSITIGTETVVQAQWSGSQTHRVSWTLGSGITNIQGFDVTANININNNAQVEIGHTVRLTATVDSGYTFTNWTGGVTSTNNPVEFSVGGSDITVTANATETKVYRTIRWATGTGITKITGYDMTAETTISNMAQVESGHSISLTADVTVGYTFNGWTGDITSSDNPLVFTINSDTTVSANAVQSCILNYTYDGYINRVSAQYRDSGETINTGDIVEVGAYVTLEAAPKIGCEFTEWAGLPSGVDPTQNPVTFTTVAGTMSIEANGKSVTTEYVLNITNGDGVDHSVVTVNGDNKGSVARLEVAANADVIIKSFPQSEYKISGWEFVPEITPTAQTEDSVEFNMIDNIEVTVKAIKDVENGFYYYGTNTNDNGEAGEGNTKWFTDVKYLIPTESDSQRIEENEFNYIYVVCNSENVPICTCEELEDPIKFVPLDNKCGDIDVYDYFAGRVRWIEENSNRTQGPLASKGQYIYILIDSGLKLKSKNITIALSNE